MHVLWLAAPAVFSAEELAHACGMAPVWVHSHVAAQTLRAADMSEGVWRFDSDGLVRARRIAHLEVTFDADPQLAALTVDLLEEVALLRRQLQMLRSGDDSEVLDT